jgi:hypothetical protein
MTLPRLGDIVRDAGVPDLVEILAERLTPLELETVLLEAHRQRVGRMTPHELLDHYQRDGRVQPSPARASAYAEIDRAAQSASAPAFEFLDLSPICPPGTAAVMAPVDPAAAWSAGGTSEVVSKCVSVLALECARRRADPAAGSRVRLSASHRELHAPFSAQLGTEPHARVFALCTAGAEEKDLRFEIESLQEQLHIHLRVLEQLRREGFRIGLVSVAVSGPPDADLQRAIRERLVEPLATAFPEVRVVLSVDRTSKHRFCAPLGFTVAAEDHAEVEHQVGLGGLTDWTRQLLDRVGERLLVSIIATERLDERFGKEASGLS